MRAGDCFLQWIIESNQPAARYQFAFRFQQPSFIVFPFIFVIFVLCPVRNVCCVRRLDSRFTFLKSCNCGEFEAFISYVADQLDATITVYLDSNQLNMFRAMFCPSSGAQACVLQHVV